MTDDVSRLNVLIETSIRKLIKDLSPQSSQKEIFTAGQKLSEQISVFGRYSKFLERFEEYIE